jgi:hypothetical protein
VINVALVVMTKQTRWRRDGAGRLLDEPECIAFTGTTPFLGLTRSQL